MRKVVLNGVGWTEFDEISRTDVIGKKWEEAWLDADHRDDGWTYLELDDGKRVCIRTNEWESPWYAVMRESDDSWDDGSYDWQQARRLADLRHANIIAEIDDRGCGPVCIGEWRRATGEDDWEHHV